MSYRIERPNGLIPEIHRIARGEIDKALRAIDDAEEDVHEAVHQVRKKCKKLRALLRLVRPPLGESYSEENRWFRDTARLVSDDRDAHVMVETCEQLLESYQAALDVAAFRPVLDALEERRSDVVGDRAILERLAEARQRLEEGRTRVAEWSFEEDGFEALAGGLAKTYGRFRERWREATEEPTTELLHQWRKRAKYHRYHVRLMRGSWRRPFNARRDELHRLSDLLGEDHDLANLASRLEALDLDEELRVPLVGSIDERRDALQRGALSLGRRLAAESVDALVDRFEVCWRAWESETSA